MAKKRRLLGFSTVTAVVAVAMTFCVISESKKTNFNYEETSNIKGKSEAKGSISEEKLTDNKKVVNEKNAKEVAEMVIINLRVSQLFLQISMLISVKNQVLNQILLVRYNLMQDVLFYLQLKKMV